MISADAITFFDLKGSKRYHGFHRRAIKMSSKDDASGTIQNVDFTQELSRKDGFLSH